MKNSQVKIIIIIQVILMCFYMPVTVNANDDNNGVVSDYINDYFEEYKIDDIDKDIKNSTINCSFSSIVSSIIKGDFKNVWHIIVDSVKNTLAREIYENKDYLIRLIIICIIAAIIKTLSDAFENKQLSDTSHFIILLMIVTLLMNVFSLTYDISQSAITGINDFMNVIVVTIISAITVSAGTMSAAAYYEVIIIGIFLVNKVFMTVVLQGARIYLILSLINNINEEAFFDKCCVTIKKGLSLMVKVCLTIVFSINVVQSMVTPASDSIGTSILIKSLGAIPTIGGVATTASSALIGAGTLVKNGIGAAALIIIILICIIPCVKLLIFYITYTIIAMLMQPISDKRIIRCISGLTDTIKIQMSAVIGSGLMFIINIAVMCVATNFKFTAM